jgi:hypothetical protein
MIKIDTKMYIGAQGRPPRGEGMWKFQIDKSNVSIVDNWLKAKKKAIDLAIKANATTILLIP